VELRHRDCGAEVHAELRCTEGHPLTVSDLDLVARPAKAREIAGHDRSR
jgi:hypothetical protein